MVAVFFIFFGVGVLLFFKGFSTLKKKRKIENTPTSKIRSVSIGEVEVYGEALPAPNEETGNPELDAEKVVSPFTKKECVYYLTMIEELRQEGKHSRWVTIHSKSYIRPFYIKDETGKILIDPKGAMFNVPIDFEETSGFRKDPSKQVQNYLSKNKIAFEGFFGMNKKMKYTERIIEVKDKVYVFGSAMPSGKMSSVGSENLVISKKRRSDFFFISDRPEKEVLNFFGKRMFWEIYGGAALSIACFIVLLVMLPSL